MEIIKNECKNFLGKSILILKKEELTKEEKEEVLGYIRATMTLMGKL